MDKDRIYQYEPLWGEWHVKGFIGEGSFGRVYIIERTVQDTVYRAAAKLITIPTPQQSIEAKRSFGSDHRARTAYFKDIVDNVVNEINLLNKLSGSGHVVEYKDHLLSQNDDGSYDIIIRMELLTDLRDYYEQHPATVRDIIRMARDVCMGLGVCAKYGVVHRDIKMDNIFMSEHGLYKIGDFGVSRFMGTGGASTVVGTYDYMAPEVMREGRYDGRVDIYSLGLVLYRLLNNERMPFVPPYPADMKMKDRDEAYRLRITGASFAPPANAPSALWAVIQKACAYDPAARFACAEEMRQALEEAEREISHEKLNHTVYPPALVSETRPGAAETKTEAAPGIQQAAGTSAGVAMLGGSALPQSGAKSVEDTASTPPTVAATDARAAASSTPPQSGAGSDAGTVYMFEGADGSGAKSFCNMCGAKLREDEAFCTKCGAPVKKKAQGSPAGNSNPPAYRPPQHGGSNIENKQKAWIYAAFGVLIVAVFTVLLASGVFSDKAIVASRDEERQTEDANYGIGTPVKTAITAETSDTSAQPVVQNNLIILSNAFSTAPYGVAFNESAIAQGERLGYEVQVQDGQWDVNMQLDHAQMAIETAAGFIYLPVDVESSAIVIDMLREADFPYIVASNYTREAAVNNDVACFVGSDMTRHGENMAQAVSELVSYGSNIIVMGGMAGHPLTAAIDEALYESLAANPGIFLISQQYTDYDAATAQAVMDDMITVYGHGFDLVVAYSDEICSGVIEALKAARFNPGDIQIVTQGSSASIRDYMVSGWITCTSTYDPGMESALGVETLGKILNGETVEQIITIEHDLCYIDDIDNYHWF